GDRLCQFKLYCTPCARIHIVTPRIAIKVAGSIRRFEIPVRQEKGLNIVISGGKLIQILNRKRGCPVVESRPDVGAEIFDVAPKDYRSVCARVADRSSRIPTAGFCEDDQKTPRCRLKQVRNLKTQSCGRGALK